MFTLIKKDKNSRARVGVIKTAHGEIETPAYVMVATRGVVKTLNTEEVHRTGTQLLIANTFHLWQEQLPEIERAGGIHEQFGWDGMPLMTDSGGFQVFSYGFSREHDIGKVGMFVDEHHRRSVARGDRKEKNRVTITNEGVRFHLPESGAVVKYAMLTPGRSMEIQQMLGADIIFAFDECTSPEHNYEYTKEALERTHRWARACCAASLRPYQHLYGIVQGGHWRDLREESARFMNALPFSGYGIGGSLGRTKQDMANVLDWTIPLLDERRPRHLLGIGAIGDVVDGIARGIDTFDCVIPTREARHGSNWTRLGRYDVRNAASAVPELLEQECECDACATTTQKTLREMFRSRDQNAGRLATIHNMFFFNRLMADARIAIREGSFDQFRRETIGRFLLKR